jgi:hypothetical protein
VQGADDDAAACFKRALEMDPSHSGALRGLREVESGDCMREPETRWLNDPDDELHTQWSPPRGRGITVYPNALNEEQAEQVCECATWSPGR